MTLCYLLESDWSIVGLDDEYHLLVSDPGTLCSASQGHTELLIVFRNLYIKQKFTVKAYEYTIVHKHLNTNTCILNTTVIDMLMGAESPNPCFLRSVF